MSALDAYHVRKFIVAEVRDVTRLFLPRIPNDRVRKVVLLHAHFPTGNDIRDDMLRLRILIDSVGPFAHRDDVAAFLVNLVVPSLCAWMKYNLWDRQTGLRAAAICNRFDRTPDLTGHCAADSLMTSLYMCNNRSFCASFKIDFPLVTLSP